jgi:hypothetical protein
MLAHALSVGLAAGPNHKPGGVALHVRPTRVAGPHPLMDRDIRDVAAEQAG